MTPICCDAATISFTIAASPLGRLLLAATERGICTLQFGDRDADLEASLEADYPDAVIERDDAELQSWMGDVLGYLKGERLRLDLPLDVRGTAFQRRVWEELRAIPTGSTRSYRQVAEAVGRPKAVRAVGQACAANPVAVLIPCHRVLRSDGGLGGYAGTLDRKKRLLELEDNASAKASLRQNPRMSSRLMGPASRRS